MLPAIVLALDFGAASAGSPQATVTLTVSSVRFSRRSCSHWLFWSSGPAPSTKGLVDGVLL